jgi:beta-alanine degradation protein BauB
MPSTEAADDCEDGRISLPMNHEDATDANVYDIISAMRFVLSSLALCVIALGQAPAPIDNDQVNVTTVTSPAAAKSGMHVHKLNRVMIYLDAAGQKIVPEGGRARTTHYKAGQVEWSPAEGRHTSENVGGKAFRVVKIDVKSKGSTFQAPALDPVRVHSTGYKPEFENEQVRVVRVHMRPHEKIPLHEHTLNRVVVFLTPAKMRVTPEGGTPVDISPAAHEVRFSGPGRHIEENLGGDPVELLMVEVK